MVVSYTEHKYSFDPPSSGAWGDVDLSGAGVPANAIVEIVMVNVDSGAENTMGVRENGSSLTRSLVPHESEGGGGDFLTLHVTADADSKIEAYSSDIGNSHMLVIGWWS